MSRLDDIEQYWLTDPAMKEEQYYMDIEWLVNEIKSLQDQLSRQEYISGLKEKIKARDREIERLNDVLKHCEVKR